MKNGLRAAALLGIFALTGCFGEDRLSNPDGIDLEPGDIPRGGLVTMDPVFPRQVIMLWSAPSEKREFIWDPGLSTERRLTGDRFNRYVQIPEDAPRGKHIVRMVQPGWPETKFVIPVLQPAPFPKPRIEDISVTRVEFAEKIKENEFVRTCAGRRNPKNASREDFNDLPAKYRDTLEDIGESLREPEPDIIRSCTVTPRGVLVDVTFSVTVANADLNAAIVVHPGRPSGPVLREKLSISEVALNSAMSLGTMTDRKPETYGYPIYHFTQFQIVVKGLISGRSYFVAVRNRNSVGDMTKIDVPVSPEFLDSDNDLLSNEVEEELQQQGIDADPFRKTILLEADWLDNATPKPEIWQIAMRAFADAPVLNPDGSRGIDLIIDRGQDRDKDGPFKEGGKLPFGSPFLELRDCGAMRDNCVALMTIKQSEFDKSRKEVFYYMIFGDWSPGFSSGKGDMPGWNAVVTNNSVSGYRQAGTMIHELGHNLGLRHSGKPSIDTGDRNEELGETGEQNSPWTPNTPSVMSYRWSSFGSSPDLDCDMKPDGKYTYSMGTLADFDESRTSERDGICDNRPVDIDQDMDIENDPPTFGTSRAHCWVSFDKWEGCDDDTDDIHRDGNQWGTVARRIMPKECDGCRSWLPKEQ